MKKIYVTDPAKQKTLHFLQVQAEEAMARDSRAGSRAAIIVSGYIATMFPEVKRWKSFGMWKDERGIFIVCFDSIEEHARFTAEIVMKGKKVAMGFGTREALAKAAAQAEQGD